MTPRQRLALTRFALAVLREIDDRPASVHLSGFTLARLTAGVATVDRRRHPDGKPYPKRSPHGFAVRVTKPYRKELHHDRPE